MSLFPTCQFKFHLNGGGLSPGKVNRVKLELEVPAPIPRAEFLLIEFVSVAWADFGSGKSRRREKRDLLRLPFRQPIEGGVLAKGTHPYFVDLDLPRWLPVAMTGLDCEIVHVLSARLDVDWAIDPHEEVRCDVLLPPRDTRRRVETFRSPDGYHAALVVEVALAPVAVAGETLSGTVAIRAGAEALRTGLDVDLTKVSRIALGSRDARSEGLAKVHLERSLFADGQPAPFRLPIPRAVTQRTGTIDTDFAVEVCVPLPFAADPTFQIPIEVLPAGSRVVTDAGASSLVGEARLREVAKRVAERLGLALGARDALVSGANGNVEFVLRDAPRGGRLGVEALLSFASLGLDINLRPRRLIDALRFQERALSLPGELGERFLWHASVPPDRYDEAPFDQRTLDRIFGGLARVDELRMNDHMMAFHVSVEGTTTSEEEALMVAARLAQEKAALLSTLIAELPFPRACAASREAWELAAKSSGGVLVPTRPAIVNVPLVLRGRGGEARSFALSLGTDWSAGEPQSHVEVAVGFDLPRQAAERLLELPLESALAAHRPSLSLGGNEGATILHASFEGLAPPVELMGLGETLAAWALEMRGEGGVVAPYR